MMDDLLGSTLLLRAVGAVAGTILALALTPPKTISGCVQRVIVGLGSGLVFSGQVHAYAGQVFSNDADGLISAACSTSFVSWQALTIIKRMAANWKSTKERAED